MSFKICVIGCGGIARLAHGNAYKKYACLHKAAVLAACCDIEAEKAETFKNEYGFERSYSDYRLMLEKEQPNAVCLNVPVHLTARLSASILEKGYPLLLEKPPGVNKQELAMIMRAAEKSKAPHMVAFNRRFTPVIEALYNKIHGIYQKSEIQNIGCEFFRVGRTDDDFSTTSIHGIDTVRHLAGCVYESADFFYQNVPRYGGNVRNVVMQCALTSGAAATLRFMPMCGVTIERYTVNVGQSTFVLKLPWEGSIDKPGGITEYAGGKKVFELSGAELSGPEFYESNGFYRENEIFFDAIQNGGRLDCDVYSAVQSVEIAECIRLRKPFYQRGNT